MIIYNEIIYINEREECMLDEVEIFQVDLPPFCEDTDQQSILDMLCSGYMERFSVMDDPMEEDFARLHTVLCELGLEKEDVVWALLCGLCSRHIRNSFIAGVRVGIQLKKELGL